MSKHPLPIEPGTLARRTTAPKAATPKDAIEMMRDFMIYVHCVMEVHSDGTFTHVTHEDVELPPNLPLREYPAPRIPDLCPDDEHQCTQCNGDKHVNFVRCSLCGGTGWAP